jgi:hypothetical protein
MRRAEETAKVCGMATIHLLLALPLALCLPSRGSDEAPTLEAGPLKFQWVKDHFERPGGTELGNTHGVIVSDSQGHLYVNTDTEKAIMVYDREGRFVRAFGADLAGGVHGMVVNREADGEYLYLVHHALSEWRKLTLDGRTVLKRGAPLESGKYDSAAQFHPTSIAVASDGTIFVADGYGLSWVHRYDAQGNWLSTFGGPGAEKGQLNCPHGLLVDKRRTPETLLVADRGNHRLQVFDLEGRPLSIIEGMFRLPCSMQERDGYLAVPDLAGRVTILDKDNQLVGHLGDNPDESLRAQNGVPRERWRDGVFIAPHSAHFDAEGNLMVMDWNHLGRINKLARLADDGGAQAEAKQADGHDEGVGYLDTPLLPDGKWRVHDKHRPVPRVVTPGEPTTTPPPADAIVLFDGGDLSRWRNGDKDGTWKVESGWMEVNGSGGIETKEGFGDCQLHLEFATPAKIEGEGQGRGNSGLFLMQRYEVQILDSYQNRTYADGQCAALYGQLPPLVNASRAPGEWQSYDILFKAPRFDGAKLVSPAKVTVVHNGVVVQWEAEFLGATAHRAVAQYAPHAAELPIGLQDHGNPMRFRNIWVRRL